MTYEELVAKFGKPAADRSFAAAHATKTAICQLWYNRMEITDAEYTEVTC
jgi:hypothetical protein